MDETQRAQERLLSDVRAFMKSRIILTAAELDFFSLLDNGPLPAPELCKRARTDLRATTRLLDALVTLGLLEKDAGRYGSTAEGRFLSAAHPETLLPMVHHMGSLWETWGTLTQVVSKGSARDVISGLKFDEKDWKAFIGAMHVAARELSQEIAEAFDGSRFRCLLDVGGGSGAYTIAFLRGNPRMKAVLFDLEEVIAISRERIAEEGFADRATCIAGDFYEQELPRGCDLALLSAIIHQNSPAENEELFRKVFRALDPGGAILIRDHVMEESRTAPPQGVLFAINMLVNTHGGDTYTFREIEAMLKAAGFTAISLLRPGEKMDCLVEALKPSGEKRP